MTRAEATALEALLVDIGNLAESSRMCSQHTFYSSSNADSMKKYRRTDEQVRTWLDRLASAHARLETLRGRINGLST